MCDLFALNYSGPIYNTIKRDNKKCIQHVSGEHGETFAIVAKILKDAKVAHNIIGPTLVILAEDDTKVKSKVSNERIFWILWTQRQPHVCIRL